jgi:hypothetical protein
LDDGADRVEEPVMTETRRDPVVEDPEVDVRRIREGLIDFDRRLREFVQAQPLTALVGAVVAGYVVARVFRRV